MTRDQDLVERWVRNASHYSEKDLLIAIYVHIRELEITVSELTQAVADLQTAVQGVADRVGPAVTALQEALAAANAANQGLQASLDQSIAADVADDEAFAAQVAQLQADLAAANAAAGEAAATIEANVGQLNTIAAAPPAEPPVA